MSQGRTYIDRSFSMLVWVFGIAPISIGHFPCWFEFSLSFQVGTTPILIGHSSCQFSLSFLGPHPYWSVIHHVSLDRVSGPHLYQSVITLLVWVCIFGTTPISIGHFLINWVESCSASSHVYLVESFGLEPHLNLHLSSFFVCWSLLVSVIFVLFIISWSSAIHCIYTPHIGCIFG